MAVHCVYKINASSLCASQGNKLSINVFLPCSLEVCADLKVHNRNVMKSLINRASTKTIIQLVKVFVKNDFLMNYVNHTRITASAVI